MGNFTEKVRGLTSRRVTDVHDPTPQPTDFQVYGGWGPALDDLAEFSPEETERARRVAGAVALAELATKNDERKREEMDHRLAGVRRGYGHGRA